MRVQDVELGFHKKVRFLSRRLSLLLFVLFYKRGKLDICTYFRVRHMYVRFALFQLDLAPFMNFLACFSIFMMNVDCSCVALVWQC